MGVLEPESTRVRPSLKRKSIIDYIIMIIIILIILS